MRRFLMILAAAVFILSGCKAKNDSEKAALTAYEGYYRAVSENERFTDGSLYYDLNCEMSRMPDGTYRYYVFLDDAQVAMYDVVFMAVENDLSFDRSIKMMPSVGIFDQEEYSLIPYQSNSAAGFVKGLVIGGECNESEILLKILVEWKDKNREKTYREYVSYLVTPSGYSHPSQLYENGEEEEETEESE